MEKKCCRENFLLIGVAARIWFRLNPKSCEEIIPSNVSALLYLHKLDDGSYRNFVPLFSKQEKANKIAFYVVQVWQKIHNPATTRANKTKTHQY